MTKQAKSEEESRKDEKESSPIRESVEWKGEKKKLDDLVRNVKTLDDASGVIQERILHAVLAREYCNNYPTDRRRCCDCVNISVTQFVNEVVAYENSKKLQQKNAPMKKTGKRVAFVVSPASSGGAGGNRSGELARFDEIVFALKKENEDLKRAIDYYESICQQIQKMILDQDAKGK